MRFMLLQDYYVEGVEPMPTWPPGDAEAHIAFQQRLNDELRERGELVEANGLTQVARTVVHGGEGALVGAEGLAAPAQARIVRAGKDGAPEVTDGPFADAKEFLAGYWIVDVERPEQAYAIAARASAAPGPGGRPMNLAIEVREVMSAPPVDA